MNFKKRYEELGHKVDISLKLRQSIRVNTLKIDEPEIVNRLKKKMKLEKIKFTDNGYYVKSKFSIGSTPEYLQGYYYIQEAAAQLPVKILDPKPGDSVLDMAAAPGGKTTQIAQMMKHKGVIVALDYKAKRLPALKNNLERMGCTNVVVYEHDGVKVRDLGMKFNKILLDAPCSGNYVGEKDWFSRRDIDGVKQNARLQRKLLEAAVSVLNKNGVLVYSTCSLEPEEDEDNVKWVLENCDMKLEKIEIAGLQNGSTIEGCLKLWPGKTQGFFVAKLRKK